MDISLPSISNAISAGLNFNHRDSMSSDEDGLREVQPEELEDLDMQDLNPMGPQDASDPALAANQQNPHFNATWDRDQSGIAKKLGVYALQPQQAAFIFP